MLTLVHQFKKVLLLFLIFNMTWALKDRALFSINEYVYFYSDYNKLVKSFNVLKCAKKIKELELYINSKGELKSLEISKGVIGYNSSKEIEKVASLIQLFTLSGSHELNLKNVSLGNCNSKDLSKNDAFKLLRANDYLKKRILTSGSSEEKLLKTLEIFKKTTVKRIDYRSFY